MSNHRMRTVLGQLGLTQIRYVSPVRAAAADGLTAQVYRQLERDFGLLAPPVTLHSPAAEVLAASWLMLRESLLVTGVVDRPVKEAVATAVSLGNECPFCVTVHSGTLHGLVRAADAATLADDHVESLADPTLRAVARWARASGSADTAARQQPPFPAEEAPELVGTAVLLHYLNRMVNVFLGEVPLPPGVPRLALGPVMRVLGGMIRAAADTTPEPGLSLPLLPPAPHPADLAWAAPSPTVADGFARAYAAVERAGAESVPAPVRELVGAQLADWHGEHRGPSRAWAADAVAALPQAQRPAARLALLTAIASYQVDRSVVEQFRRDHPDDRTLIELTSWASLSAARRVSTWMTPTATAPEGTAVAEDGVQIRPSLG